MRQYIYTLSVFLVLLFSGPAVHAQTQKSFSTEPTQWFKDMKEFLSAANKSDAKDLMEKLEPVWLQGKLTADEQMQVMDLSNFMLKKRLRAFPEFRDYINAVIGFTTSGQSADAFKKWHQSLDKILTGKTRQFSDYIETCSGLFASNTFYESASCKWTSSSSTYVFEYDSMPYVTFAMAFSVGDF